MEILGISGSLRKASYNTAALKAAKSMLPAGISLNHFDISSIPLYNEDIREKGFPDRVQQLRDSINKSDALLIVTPEYNYSVPGVLKNVIDWASRPPNQPFDRKPIGIMGASPGMLGSSRAQYHLRQMFIFLNGMIMNTPEVMITAAHTKFDDKGNLIDQSTKEIIQKFLSALIDWANLLNKNP